VRKLVLGYADSQAAAVVRAGAALAGLTVVSIIAPALAGLAVAKPLHWAFRLGVGAVVRREKADPRGGLRVSAL
jgi:hypothetical protein